MADYSSDIEKKIEQETALSLYRGPDRVVFAEDKRQEIEVEKKSRPPFRATTGLTKLDDCVDGFRRGQLIIISGPLKAGKSSLAKTFTKSFVAQGLRCIWFSYELSYEELFENFPMGIMDFYVPNIISSGNLKWVEDRIIEAKRKHDASVVFIDNLDFLRDPNDLRRVEINLATYVGGIVQRIKRIAVEQNLVIFLLAHIRKNQWASQHLPASEEIRDSGMIAQLADIVIMIMRKRAPKSALEDIYIGNEAIVGVVENRRNGKTKKIPVQLVNNEFIELYESSFRSSEESASRDW